MIFLNQSTHLISFETPPRVQRFKRCTFNSFIVLTNTKSDFPAPKAPENFDILSTIFSFLQSLRASEVGAPRFPDGNSTSNCGWPYESCIVVIALQMIMERQRCIFLRYPLQPTNCTLYYIPGKVQRMVQTEKRTVSMCQTLIANIDCSR